MDGADTPAVGGLAMQAQKRAALLPSFILDYANQK
jgi:hypothetical protein